ncbi:MAG: hypothetical protein JNJ55_08170 [Betaproteobacteria bacterium]|nr:hypothetical protein [Betaproteobacteria bacterium]
MLGTFACALAQAPSHAQSGAPKTVAAAAATIIYKHVDDNGRVTYANSPIPGGVRVELEPITVIPSSPSGSLGQTQAPAVAAAAPLPVPVAPIPREAQAPIPSSPAAPALAVPVARVVPSGFRAPNEKITVKGAPRAAPREANVDEADDTPRPMPTRSNVIVPASIKSSQAIAALPVASVPTWPAGDAHPAALPVVKLVPKEPIAPPAAESAAQKPQVQPSAQPSAQQIPAGNAVRPLIMTASLSPEAAQKITEQRRADTRKRLLEGELQAEEQLLSHAKLALTEEQRLTPSIRALRASFAASSDAGTQPPTKAQRETIERHFERVRNLQDQVSMHETHLKGLREQIALAK